MSGIFNVNELADNKYTIGFNQDLYDKAKENTPFKEMPSYNIISARVLGVTYAEFLRWARDNYNGIIKGKGNKYPLIVFDNKNDCRACCLFLTRRLNGLA